MEDRHPKRVLIVEDEESSRTALQSILESEGFEVEAASDGVEVHAIARRFRPDVVVMDLVLPIVNGFEAASRLRRDSDTARIPLLAVTASWLGSQEGALREVGFDAALRKPFAGERLVEELRRLLDGGATAAGPSLS